MSQTHQVELLRRMNERLDEVKTKYELTLNKNQTYIDQLRRKLAVFDELPRDQQFLAAMSLEELLQVVAKIYKEPFVIYETIEKVFHKDFFDAVIQKKYSELFEENAEEKFKRQIEDIRASTVEQIAILKVNAAHEIDFHKSTSQ